MALKKICPSSITDDHSDRKSLELLVKQLLFKKNSTKQLSISQFCMQTRSKDANTRDLRSSNSSKAANTRDLRSSNSSKSKNTPTKIEKLNKKTNKSSKKKSKANVESKQPNLNNWLASTNQCELANDRNTVNSQSEMNRKRKKKSDNESLSSSSENKSSDLKTQKRKRSKPLKRQSSGSFAKYGVNLPSVEDAINYKKKLDELKKCLNDFESLEDSVESLDLYIDEPTKPVEVLDCKHLSDEQLEIALEQNYLYLCDIFHGISTSQRHKKFQKENYRDNFTTKDLKYNTSMITFTFEQKQLLLSYLYEKFDQSKFGNSTQYFFKVLLPELCTKIFMDTHKMTYDEAILYLDSRPID